jgi:Phage integrase family.
MKKDYGCYTIILHKSAMLISILHGCLSYYFISPIIVHFHELSHTGISLMFLNNESIPAISKRAGHGNTAVTMSIYAHAIQGTDRIAADRIEDLITRTKRGTNGGSPQIVPSSAK